MKKCLIRLILTSMVCVVLCVPVFATGTINEDNIEFTPEEIAEQISIDNRLLEMSDILIPNPMLRMRAEFEAPVTQRQQINDHYCGPACTQMVYEGITGDESKSQTWFAGKLETTDAGTSSLQIANTLRELTGANYSVANVYSSNQDVLTVYRNIANSLRQGYAVVANVKQIPGRYTTGSGHFITVYRSIIETEASLRYSYIDPHYNNNYYGSFGISGIDMQEALLSNAGNYVRVPS